MVADLCIHTKFNQLDFSTSRCLVQNATTSMMLVKMKDTITIS